MADSSPNVVDPPTATGRTAGWMLALPLLAVAVYFARLLPAVAGGETFQFARDWVPSLGLRLSFTLDGLSLLFVLMVCVVGTLVLIYAGGYMAGRKYLGRFFTFLVLFTVSMLGLVLADNLLLLYVFWELTSICSYFLIGFESDRPQARAAALQALLVTGGGGLALLAGVILLARAGGSYELSALLNQGDALRTHALYVPALLLILAGAFTKSAQFPFHFWLPGAMEAPTPVSAYLHSATMVKAGVYLMARLSPALGGTELWLWTVTGVGGVTMVVAAWMSLTQSDLKRILAYSTVSALGMLTFLIGLGGPLASQAAMAYLIGHALYKGALFFVAGSVDHETGTRDINQLSGLGKAMPMTALASAVAALSMAGLPPLFGFIAKELAYEATLHAPAKIWITTAAVTASVLLIAAAALAGLRPFLGKARTTPRPAHEAPLSMLLGPLVLGVLSLVFGVWPAWAADALVSAATSAVVGQQQSVHLALWHGVTPPLVLSAITLACGIAVYAARGLILRLSALWGRAAQWGPAGWYELALRGLNGLAISQTRLLQSGYLRHYLMITVGATVALVGYALFARGVWRANVDWTDLRIYEAALAALILMAILMAILKESRLAAIAALGVVGYGVALIFVLFGAPDLAMTQFLVETLTVILFVLVFYHLPEDQRVREGAGRWRDAALAIAVGGLMSALVLVGTPENFPPISSFFDEHSVPQGHGRNVVNVILVDFRAMDTMGEITVLSIAAAGVYALLKLRKRPDSVTDDVEQARAEDQAAVTSDVAPTPEPPKPPRATDLDEASASFILRPASRLLFPLLLLFSIFLLFRGHNEPGGGFSGGLVAASAFILYRFAFGVQATRGLLPVSPLSLFGGGLLISASCGVLALLEGYPLLTALWSTWFVPGFGELHVGTPLLFDVGVYITVIGVTLTIILPLAEE